MSIDEIPLKKMIFFMVFALARMTSGLIYQRCVLARELKFVHKAPNHQLATWVCIAEHESQYNTSIVGHLNGDGSGDHGIFQISDKYWCSPPGKDSACGLTCAELEDDNISDDFICAQRIYKEHKQLSGDGFNAWAVYAPLCKGAKADRYIKDCFNDSGEPKSLSTPSTAFAHGVFDAATGRANKGFSTSTPKQDALLSFSFPVTKDQKYSSTTENLPSSPLSPFLLNENFLRTSENFDLFFTPTSSSTFRPAISTTVFSPSVSTPSMRKFTIFKPIKSPPTGVIPATSRSAFDFEKIFTQTPRTTVYQDINFNQPIHRPIFIINGVKWY